MKFKSLRRNLDSISRISGFYNLPKPSPVRRRRRWRWRRSSSVPWRHGRRRWRRSSRRMVRHRSRMRFPAMSRSVSSASRFSSVSAGGHTHIIFHRLSAPSFSFNAFTTLSVAASTSLSVSVLVSERYRSEYAVDLLFSGIPAPSYSSK